MDELAEKLVAQLQRIRCSLRVKRQEINNFLGGAVTKVNKFQIKFPQKWFQKALKWRIFEYNLEKLFRQRSFPQPLRDNCAFGTHKERTHSQMCQRHIFKPPSKISEHASAGNSGIESISCKSFLLFCTPGL